LKWKAIEAQNDAIQWGVDVESEGLKEEGVKTRIVVITFSQAGLSDDKGKR
jgi:hypothetical protein